MRNSGTFSRVAIPFLLTSLMPVAAFALASGGFMGTAALILYAIIGALGGFSVVIFVSGFILYIVRLGTERRAEGIFMMEWGVTSLFVAVVFIWLLRWIE